MILAWLLLLTGLTISAVAIYYSVVGLAAIFAAATVPIYIMGTTLEVAKLVCASWLKANWERVPLLMKTYMTIAVVVLMFITSMGIFGFLSKAHSDQSLVSGNVISKLEIIDEKIKTEKENINAARTALSQMDSQVNERLSRSNDDRGAERAVQIRKQQQAERARLQKDIATSQSNINKLNDEAAPIRAEVRKVEAEVGPIKYIAKFVYGDDSDTNLLEKAVTWVIIIIVAVFDPLAVIMLLAAQMTFQWARSNKQEETITPVPVYPADDGPLTDNQVEQIKETAKPTKATFVDHGEHPKDTYGYEEQTQTDVPANEPVTATGGDITAPEEQPTVEGITVEQWNKMIAEAEKAVEAELARGEQLLQAEDNESKKKTYMTKNEQGKIEIKSRS